MEVVIFVGLQAAGKTTFYLNHFAGTHSHVSKDLLWNSRTRQARQMALMEQELKMGKSVVVDNTNPRVEDRAPIITLGKAFRRSYRWLQIRSSRVRMYPAQRSSRGARTSQRGRDLRYRP